MCVGGFGIYRFARSQGSPSKPEVKAESHLGRGSKVVIDNNQVTNRPSKPSIEKISNGAKHDQHESKEDSYSEAEPQEQNHSEDVVKANKGTPLTKEISVTDTTIQQSSPDPLTPLLQGSASSSKTPIKETIQDDKEPTIEPKPSGSTIEPKPSPECVQFDSDFSAALSSLFTLGVGDKASLEPIYLKAKQACLAEPVQSIKFDYNKSLETIVREEYNNVAQAVISPETTLTHDEMLKLYQYAINAVRLFDKSFIKTADSLLCSHFLRLFETDLNGRKNGPQANENWKKAKRFCSVNYFSALSNCPWQSS